MTEIIPAGDSDNPLAQTVLDDLLNADMGIMTERLKVLVAPSWFDGILSIAAINPISNAETNQIITPPMAVFSGYVQSGVLTVTAIQSGQIIDISNGFVESNTGNGVVASAVSWSGGTVDDTGETYSSGFAQITSFANGGGAGDYNLVGMTALDIPDTPLDVNGNPMPITMRALPITTSVPTLRALLSGGAYNLLWVYTLYQYALKQSRISTASGVWLDRIAYDFFGNTLPRLSGEQDEHYRTRIYAELFRERQTREAIIQALVDLTGRIPTIIEPWNTGDVGCYAEAGQTTQLRGVMGYGSGTSTVDGHTVYGGYGCYGSLQFPYQIWVVAYRPQGDVVGIPNIIGYGYSAGGYGEGTAIVDGQTAHGGGQIKYSQLSEISGPVTDAMITAAIDSVVAAGIKPWIFISN